LKGFIETNLMVQLEFNLVFWFVSYKIFLLHEKVGPTLSLLSSLTPARWLPATPCARSAAPATTRFSGRPDKRQK
jgi:hypothetical protein